MAPSARLAGLWILALLLACLGVKAAPRRVVSLVPSLTESVVALGGATQLVGRSRYCVHPAWVKSLPQVGGYLDPSWEAILGLKPDLLLLTPESRESAQRAEQLGIPVLSISQNHLGEVLAGLRELGQALGREARGRSLADSLEQGLRALRRRAAQRKTPRPRVLLVADRPPLAGAPRDLWVIGQGSWLSELLEAVGAVNAAQGLAPAQPMLSREGLAALDPDWIIELWPTAPTGRTLAQLAADWQAYPELRAVRRSQVRALGEDALLVPGPRLLQAASLLEKLIFAPAAGR